MENGLVTVNAYAVVNGITYPLLFEPFKPNKRLRSGDPYRTKPELAVKLLEQVQAWGFRVGLVLADSLYGESGDVIRALERRGLPFIVAIRSNHSVLMPQGAKKRYNRWAPYQQQLSRHHADSATFARLSSASGGTFAITKSASEPCLTRKVGRVGT